MDNRGRDLDVWDKVIEKAIDIEAKASLQPLSRTRKIDSKCLKSYKLSVKKDKKHDANRENRDEDKDNAKSHNLSSANSQPQT